MLPADYAALQQIHARRGIDYAFPNLDDALFFVKKVRVVDGRVVGAGVLKLCAETILLLEGEQGPQDKLTTMQQLQEVVLDEAREKGLQDIHAAIPEIGFDKRLWQLGWEKDRPGFHLWTRRSG
jgi:hypothetical protein